MQPLVHIAVGGLLGFSIVSVEAYFLLSAFYKYYHVSTFALAKIALLLAAVSSYSVLSTFLRLNAENYHWQWHSFWVGASVAGFAVAYAVGYYQFATSMHGVLQFTFYMGYVAIASVALGSMAGAASHPVTTLFLRRIYSFKAD